MNHEPDSTESIDQQAGRFAAITNASRHPGLVWRIIACLGERVMTLRSIHVTVVGGTAVLRGEIGSSREKWLCIEGCSTGDAPARADSGRVAPRP